jgi:hypothetical protein
MEYDIKFQSALTGLWYEKYGAAGGIAAVEIDGVRFVRDTIAELPWKREREGRPGDRFDHNGCTVEVESRADGNVYYRASGKHGNHDCQNTIEEFHRLVTKAMDTGAKFTPAP